MEFEDSRLYYTDYAVYVNYTKVFYYNIICHMLGSGLGLKAWPEPLTHCVAPR